MHQGAWLVWALAGGVLALSTTNPFYLVLVLAAAWLVHATHSRSGPNARAFRVFLIFGLVTMATRTLLVFFGPVTTGSVVIAVLEGARLAVLLAVFGTFNSVADPFGVIRLAPRRFHEPALAAALALSLAPRTIMIGSQVREAQRLRGIQIARRKMLPALAVPVLETGMEQALVLAESMDARGHGSGRRSRYRTERWTMASIVTVIASVAAVALFIGAGRGDAGDMLIQTFPLMWPDVSPAMVAAVLLLATPALIAPGGSRE